MNILRDAGRKEQLSISLRFVEEGKFHEEFLCFTEVTDLTGRGLGFTIMDEMRARDLDLENLVGQGYDDAMSGAFNGAHAVICSEPEFIVATSVMHEVLAVTKPLSVQLQKVGIDLIKAMSLMDETIACLEDKRSNDASFLTVWEVAESLASVADVDLKQPRQAQRQRNRVNMESCSDQEYFKRDIYYPFLDHILSELRSRFNKHNSRIITHLWSLIPRFISSYSFSDLQPALAMYGHFLESEQAVNASTERSFSALKRLKSYCRTTMGQERLNGFAQIHIQYSVPVDIEAVINLFATSGRARRLNIIL
eukprot:Em0042g13a